jgi:glycosyltransferase involved in cell wall biosynthesis
MLPRVLVLNNYSGTGIGDFGLQLSAITRVQGFGVLYAETSPDGKGYLRQLSQAYRFPGTLVANVGLTSWGKSSVRNLIGFATLGARGCRGSDTVVLLHNIIDIMEADKTGYRITGMTRLGAKLAVWLLRRCRIVVFTKRVSAILEQRYRISPSLVHPVPCVTDASDATPVPSAGTVVNAGYIAPYKGVELFAGAAAITTSGGRWVLLGGVHRVLESNSTYSSSIQRLLKECRDAGVEVRGRVPDPEFRLALRQAAVGVLCYSSSSGASASFAAMASAGLPVVGTGVPELLEVAELGGGIVIVPPSPQEIARAVDWIYQDVTARQQMSRRQLAYAQKYSWEAFMALLVPIIKGPQG